MQKINYKEKILFEENINDLLIINIDEKLEQTKENDCYKINGEIKISGEVTTDNGNKSFYHPLDVDIMLSKEQVVNENINISIEDFNYFIEENFISIDLIMKIDGLKEIEAFFPSQENQEDFQIDKTDSKRNDEEIITNNEEFIINKDDEIDEVIKIKESENIEEITLPNKNENYSLIRQIFKNKSLKTDTSFLFHVVKHQTNYQDIANSYGIDVEKIKKANNDEEIYIGKLVFIPKD